jgi:hypothetical protein
MKIIFYFDYLNERDQFEYINLDEKVVLKCVLKGKKFAVLRYGKILFRWCSA